jgi:2,3,4,5-tetrahydropyridine-2,6-dicarboxylate N-succinyltransferase
VPGGSRIRDEGTVIKRRAVLGTGTILNRSTPVYDLVRGPGKDWSISLYTPVIVKYRDAKTGTRLQLEDLLR